VISRRVDGHGIGGSRFKRRKKNNPEYTHWSLEECGWMLKGEKGVTGGGNKRWDLSTLSSQKIEACRGDQKGKEERRLRGRGVGCRVPSKQFGRGELVEKMGWGQAGSVNQGVSGTETIGDHKLLWDPTQGFHVKRLKMGGGGISSIEVQCKALKSVQKETHKNKWHQDGARKEAPGESIILKAEVGKIQ